MDASSAWVEHPTEQEKKNKTKQTNKITSMKKIQ